MVDLWIPPFRAPVLGRRGLWSGFLAQQGVFHIGRPFGRHQWGHLFGLAPIWPRVSRSTFSQAI